MKIETITVMQRKNLGNYEHIEITASAKVEEGEEALTAMLSLKTFVEIALVAKATEIQPPAKVEEEVKPEPVEEAPKKEKKPKKEKVVETPVVEAPKKEKVTAYDSSIPEHKSIFGGYLAKKYDNSWKTSHPVEDIKAFTASLNGVDFLDQDGKIVESFLNLVHGFFGA
jgi:hypothetical protein